MGALEILFFIIIIFIIIIIIININTSGWYHVRFDSLGCTERISR